MHEPFGSRRVLWQKQRRTEIAAAAERGGVALLPTGAIEQHGPHLPVDTDTWSSFTVSVLAAEQVREFPVLVLPPLWWGLSPYWMPFAGTLSLRAETLIAVIVDVLRSVAQHGFRKAVIVNGHGGNAGLIQPAAITASGGEFRVAALSYWNLAPEVMRALSERDRGTIGHAGEMETSIQLHLQPECVDTAAVSPEQCTSFDSEQVALVVEAGGGAVYLPPDPPAEAPHGVYGWAPAASREKGERVIQACAEGLAAFVRAFRAS